VNLCSRLEPSHDTPEGEIDVVFFGDLSNTFRSMLTRLVIASKSVIFQTIWTKYCKTAFRDRMDGPLTLAEVQEVVWQPSVEKLGHLARTVNDGSATLRSIDRNFKKVNDLEKELRIMFETIDLDIDTLDKTVTERVTQINLYNSLQKGMQAVETVWQFKEALHLTGDFSIIEQLHNQVTVYS
jgi:hypothetical protein